MTGCLKFPPPALLWRWTVPLNYEPQDSLLSLSLFCWVFITAMRKVPHRYSNDCMTEMRTDCKRFHLGMAILQERANTEPSAKLRLHQSWLRRVAASDRWQGRENSEFGIKGTLHWLVCTSSGSQFSLLENGGHGSYPVGLMSEAKGLVYMECLHYGLIFSKNSEDAVVYMNLKHLGRWPSP